MQRPSGVYWSGPSLPPLSKLNDANSNLIFEKIYGEVDVFVEKLLKAIDGIPLAVTLVGTLFQEGNELRNHCGLGGDGHEQRL